MTFVKKIEISVSIALIICVIFSIVSFAQTSEKVRSEVLRLHIIANSDSALDQNLKLAVRDAILEAGAEIFDGSVTIDNATEKVLPEIERLTGVAKEVVIQRGLDYDIKIVLNKEYFTTRTYETVTLPAGEYLALRVIIGKGEGHNWWCVMFPPMCLSAANENDVLGEVLNEDELNLVNKNPKYEPRFKIIEVYENLKQRILDFKK